MDLRQLNALAAVHDHGSFSAAARALHTVQSNVSTHVARLERELGATLVDRSSGQLTEEGLAVLDRTRRINAELDAMTADVASMGDVVSGGARIGVIGTVGRWLVPRLVEAVQREHPLVRLGILDATTTSLVPLVQSGDLDLAIVNIPSAGPDLDTMPLFAEDRVLVVPTDHPLAASDHVALAEAAEHPLLMPPVGTSFRDELDGAAARAGVELTAQAEVDGMRLLASLAFQGFGPAVVPSGAVPSYVGGDWTVVAVDDLTPRSVGIVVRSKGRPSRAARAVRDRIVDVVAVQLGTRTGIHELPDGPRPAAGDAEGGRS
ncbi:LysR family transcriptional regulator [Actinomarinicola tropica]|uniref:LysR family transcriptional regulator n=1 Tax=Actinomarinicola tropica TaxID=2789776 RepID=A0A5Q2RKY8_9ACTN|nr:LysR family transcriptional regulator [Actinomarinicola tropica]QGG95096.1 LysR family transcriptional regulator [Actinomarinicola tropica]